jgi:hypothetical protein
MSMDIRFKTSTEELYDVDWRDIEILQQRDPEGRTVPGPDPNVLLLTADDCVWLWSQKISLMICEKRVL